MNSKIKSTSFVGCWFHPDFSMSSSTIFFTMRQSNSRTLVFWAGVQTLKNNKYSFVVLLVNSNTIISKCEPLIIVLFLCFFPEFDWINDQILEKLFDLCRITADNRQSVIINCCLLIIDRSHPGQPVHSSRILLYQRAGLLFIANTCIIKQIFYQYFHPARSLS